MALNGAFSDHHVASHSMGTEPERKLVRNLLARTSRATMIISSSLMYIQGRA